MIKPSLHQYFHIQRVFFTLIILKRLAKLLSHANAIYRLTEALSSTQATAATQPAKEAASQLQRSSKKRLTPTMQRATAALRIRTAYIHIIQLISLQPTAGHTVTTRMGILSRRPQAKARQIILMTTKTD